ncbi:hypothetical protein [Bacillus sp. FJAT-44742]|nr:hypothetical protein [Bacillus sp. FJAT-44742]
MEKRSERFSYHFVYFGFFIKANSVGLELEEVMIEEGPSVHEEVVVEKVN